MFTPIVPSETAWAAFVAAHPDANILQTAPWGRLKQKYGWTASRLALADAEGALVAGAQVLYRRLPLRLGSIAYVPRGPLLDWSHAALVHPMRAALDADARRHRAILLKVEPPLEDSPEAAARLSRLGFAPSPQTVQPPRTIVLDIGRDEAAILAGMKQKTRYNIRLSARKGVKVREAGPDALAAFAAMMETTGARNTFGVHTAAYYAAAYALFVPDHAALLMASCEGEDLAGAMVFALGRTAWYFYGASSNARRNLMPSYAVQWAAIQWARARGCTRYDLWGVPDADADTLEAHFKTRRDGLWGVYRFKRGFGGRLLRMAGAWDRVYNPLLYAVYRRLTSRAASNG